MSGTSLTPISFEEIPALWRVPGFLAEIRPKYVNAGLAAFPAKILIIGQSIPGSPGLTGVAVLLSGAQQAPAMYGVGSIAAIMAADSLANNLITETWIMALPDATGSTRAVGTATFTGAAAQSGVVPFNIGGVRVPSTAAAGTNGAQAAQNLAAAINATPNLPVAATVTAVAATATAPAGGVVTITALQGGSLGNNIDLRTIAQFDDAMPPGLGVAVVAMAGGAGDPDIAVAIAAMGTVWYTDVVCPWSGSGNVSEILAEGDRRYGAMVRKDMHAWMGVSGSYATLCAYGRNFNGRFGSMFGLANCLTPMWRIAAMACAAAVFPLTNDPARQLRTIPLIGAVGPAVADRFDDNHEEGLLTSGISTLDVLADGTVVFSRVITMYQTSALGVPDTAYLDLTTVKTLTRMRYDWRSYMALLYPRAKLAPDGSRADQYSDGDNSIITPGRAKGSWVSRNIYWEQLGWIVNASTLAPLAVFQINGDDPNRMDSQTQVSVIGNLIVEAQVFGFDV